MYAYTVLKWFYIVDIFIFHWKIHIDVSRRQLHLLWKFLNIDNNIYMYTSKSKCEENF